MKIRMVPVCLLLALYAFATGIAMADHSPRTEAQGWPFSAIRWRVFDAPLPAPEKSSDSAPQISLRLIAGSANQTTSPGLIVDMYPFSREQIASWIAHARTKELPTSTQAMVADTEDETSATQESTGFPPPETPDSSEEALAQTETTAPPQTSDPAPAAPSLVADGMTPDSVDTPSLMQAPVSAAPQPSGETPSFSRHALVQAPVDAPSDASDSKPDANALTQAPLQQPTPQPPAAPAQQEGDAFSIDAKALSEALVQAAPKQPEPTLPAASPDGTAISQAPGTKRPPSDAPAPQAPSFLPNALVEAPVQQQAPPVVAPAPPTPDVSPTPPQAPGEQVAALVPKPTTQRPKQLSPTAPQGAIATVDTPEALQASEKFKHFCSSFITKLNRAYDQGTVEKMKVSKRGESFVAQYRVVDQGSVRMQVKPTTYDHTPFVGVLIYSEHLMEAHGATASAAKAGSFKMIDQTKVREFFRYAKKKWQF